MKENLHKILHSKKLVINDYLVKVALSKKLTLNEFLVLAFFDSNFSNIFDIDLVSQTIGLDMSETMEAFNSLMIKGLVSLESVKDLEQRINEIVKLDGVYDCVLEDLNKETTQEAEDDIFKTFESELGRTLSPKELEMINAWVMCDTPKDIILGALREAVYNGVNHFAYIDKIIYAWTKKGFKSMDDVREHMQARREEKSKDKVISKKEQEISDFDWLDA